MKAHVFPSFCVSLKTSMRSRTRVAGGFSRGVKKISNSLSSRNAALSLLSPSDQSLPATMTLLLRLVYSPVFLEMLFNTVNEKKNFHVSFIFVYAGIRPEGHYHSAPPPKKKCNNPSQTVEKFKNEITQSIRRLSNETNYRKYHYQAEWFHESKRACVADFIHYQNQGKNAEDRNEP